MEENSKDFEAVMKEITSGFTGEFTEDFTYLQKQMEKYKDHEMGKEILRACGRLLYNMIPDDKREKLNKAINNDAAGTDAVLEEVHFNIYKKDYDKALAIIAPLVDRIESANMFSDDQVSEYHNFEEPFEEVLFRRLNNPVKEIRQAPVPFTEIYYLHGCLLFEMGRYQEAQETLKKGLRWNPVSFRIVSELSETYKQAGEFDEFLGLTRDAFKIAFRPQQIARCYRNLGYYFVEKELYPEAVAVYYLSSGYDSESKQVASELYYISQKMGGKLPEPVSDDIQKYAAQYGFPLSVSDDILGLAYGLGEQCKDQGDYETACYFFNIVYGLTGDEKIGEMIAKLSAGPEGKKEQQ